MNLGPAIAALRHVGTYAAGIVTGLMLLGVKQDTAQGVTDALVQISKSLADILQAVGFIAPVVFGWWAARSATNKSQVKSIGGMSTEDANKAVESLPATARANIRLATMPDEAKLVAVAALPDVKTIVVKETATDGVAKAAADPAQPKVVTSTEGEKL